MVDVSGILIPNNQPRVLPNCGTQLCYQKRNIPTNQAILNLSKSIGNISAADFNKTFDLSNEKLKFKAGRQRLTREELLGLARKSTSTTPAVPAMVAQAPAPVTSRTSINPRLPVADSPARMRQLLRMTPQRTSPVASRVLIESGEIFITRLLTSGIEPEPRGSYRSS